MAQNKMEKLTTKNSTELIVYQLGEVKNLLENMTLKVDNYQEKTDKRILSLELFQAAQVASANNTPKVDVQKIILAAFSLISTIVAIALGLNQGGAIK